jgi:DNA-binding FadR family transcriptional regulator
VRKAYEQIADQLRELILAGKLARGERLPNETVLAHEFGVSRATVREALRVLAAQSLIRTAKGAGGGSYVTLPTADHISEFLRLNLNLFTEAQHVSLEDLLEAREAVEVPAARLAALRRGDEDLARLNEAIPDDVRNVPESDQYARNAEFHTALLHASGNVLLSIGAQPIFTVLQTSLSRSTLGARYHAEINAHHRAIAAAVTLGDAATAESEMRDHLAFLKPYYERAWRHAVMAVDRA